MTREEPQFDQVYPTKEPDFDVHISPNYEVISVSWMDTPNWTMHPFFGEIVKEAILSGSKDGFQVISISRRTWDTAVAQLLAESLVRFEERMLRKGINTREQFTKSIDEAFREVEK